MQRRPAVRRQQIDDGRRGLRQFLHARRFAGQRRLVKRKPATFSKHLRALHAPAEHAEEIKRFAALIADAKRLGALQRLRQSVRVVRFRERKELFRVHRPPPPFKRERLRRFMPFRIRRNCEFYCVRRTEPGGSPNRRRKARSKALRLS